MRLTATIGWAKGAQGSSWSTIVLRVSSEPVRNSQTVSGVSQSRELVPYRASSILTRQLDVNSLRQILRAHWKKIRAIDEAYAAQLEHMQFHPSLHETNTTTVTPRDKEIAGTRQVFNTSLWYLGR
ncbi:hypothetical protein NUW54_g14427 [Trametes sanguinea]|uniref:Uncharacterized protein n=1 Tax=Trametes sanguinea TaxID=158606 RepID=A0ACC1MDC3_9APHY|nr:hypothetical protein NUW54_g14427 [Trametes sanguinea]